MRKEDEASWEEAPFEVSEEAPAPTEGSLSRAAARQGDRNSASTGAEAQPQLAEVAGGGGGGGSRGEDVLPPADGPPGRPVGST